MYLFYLFCAYSGSLKQNNAKN
uniref:Uncharacterized protein n=1 Tax=Anguilla anguilla TaxID=7936 RepID=A0A0E9RTP7_ANGAN